MKSEMKLGFQKNTWFWIGTVNAILNGFAILLHAYLISAFNLFSSTDTFDPPTIIYHVIIWINCLFFVISIGIILRQMEFKIVHHNT
jgi:hypothetical protein